MTGLSLDDEHGGGRFPKFDTVAQSGHWDRATEAVVGSRLGLLPNMRFFTPAEEATATALFDQLLYQPNEPRVPILQLVDTRLAENQTDGWHYDTLPQDEEAWRSSLKGLDDDASDSRGEGFAYCSWDDQQAILEGIRQRGSASWRGMPADRTWSLWTRYACTAFYSHPWAWNEIGFAGPAYPRGYKNLGIDRLEPFEVRDVRPHDDPARGDSQAAQSARRTSTHQSPPQGTQGDTG